MSAAARACTVALLAVTAALAGCGGGAPTTTPSPTADPRVAQVEDVARKFIEALDHSAITGDPNPVDAFTEDGSQARGNAGLAVDISRQAGHNFMVSREDFDDHSWQVVLNAAASVRFSYRVYGHDATWPALEKTSADQWRGPYSVRMTMHFDSQTGHWLIETFDETS